MDTQSDTTTTSTLPPDPAIRISEECSSFSELQHLRSSLAVPQQPIPRSLLLLLTIMTHETLQIVLLIFIDVERVDFLLNLPQSD